MKITKTESGKWTCHFCIGTDRNGKKKFKRITDSDKSRVKQLVAEYIAEHTADSSCIALSDAVRIFIESREEVCSPATIKGYKSMERTLNAEHVEFMRKPVDRITSAECQAFINSLHKKRNTPKTMRNFRGLISAALKHQNINMPNVHIPQGKQFEPYTPSPDEVRRLVNAVSGTRLDVPVRLGIYGLRRSEICALSRENLNGNVIHVEYAIVEDDDGNLHKKAPKTATSERYVEVDNALRDMIASGGEQVTTYTPKALSDAFTRLLNMTDLPHFRFHDLRGFFASYCHDVLHLSDAQIQKAGGWKTDNVMKAKYRRSINDAAGMIADSLGILSEVAE